MNILLSKYTAQDDIIVGTPVTGRRHIDLQNIAGMFVNMLAVRNKPGGNKTFKAFLMDVKKNVWAAMENRDYQFDELVNTLGLKREAGKNPLFNVVFNMLNVDIKEIKSGDLKVVPYEFESKTTVFDLIFTAIPGNGVINIKIIYSIALYKRSKIEKLAKRYMLILEQVLENVDVKIRDIEISHDLLPVKSGRQDESAEIFGF